MKALVLCGGLPQIALIKDLKSRGIKTLLADMNDKVAAREYADEFYKVSVLDVDAIRNLAREKEVDFLITVCADQVLQVVAEVSEDLGLPCYIDFETAVNVSKKSFMKKRFVESGVPTSKFVIMESFDEERIKGLSYPIIVKPVDAYSSRGVTKVNNLNELRAAFERACEISRTNNAIVEEFVEGREITVDVYVEEGKAHILCMTELFKIGENGKFIINRSLFPAEISKNIENEIAITAQKIADGFGLKNTPMLIQLITDGEKISVVEFCARTGGGIKFLMIKKHTGFDVVKAVADLTLGIKPHVGKLLTPDKITVNEFLYCKEGVLSHMEGGEELLRDGVVDEFSCFKAEGTTFGEINGSGDRVAYYSISASIKEELLARHKIANEKLRAVSTDGKDIIRHDLVEKFGG